MDPSIEIDEYLFGPNEDLKKPEPQQLFDSGSALSKNEMEFVPQELALDLSSLVQPPFSSTPRASLIHPSAQAKQPTERFLGKSSALSPRPETITRRDYSFLVHRIAQLEAANEKLRLESKSFHGSQNCM
jgi:hypothetical protein